MSVESGEIKALEQRVEALERVLADVVLEYGMHLQFHEGISCDQDNVAWAERIGGQGDTVSGTDSMRDTVCVCNRDRHNTEADTGRTEAQEVTDTAAEMVRERLEDYEMGGETYEALLCLSNDIDAAMKAEPVEETTSGIAPAVLERVLDAMEGEPAEEDESHLPTMMDIRGSVPNATRGQAKEDAPDDIRLYVNTLRAEVKDLRQQRDTAGREAVRFLNELTEARAEVTRMEEHQTQAARIAGENQAMVAGAIEERDEARAEVAQLRKHLKFVIDDRDRIRAEMAQEKARADAAEKKVETWKNLATTRRDQAARLNLECDRWTGRAADANKKAESYRQALEAALAVHTNSENIAAGYMQKILKDALKAREGQGDA